MKIANLELGEQPVMLAPMEDVTDASFRLIAKECGADMVYTEFVSADALIRNIAATTRKLEINSAERPVAIQIYGREPDVMVEAAKIVEEAKPDILDINFGCPVKKVAGKGAGAGLLRNVPKMLEITRAVVNAVRVPVTVKTRLGWDCENKIIVDLAEQLQDCGIAALTVHGRTRSQMYTGQADWETIARIKDNPRFRIPLIGNGDIASRAQVVEAFSRYGVDGVMVGRAAIGAPWIFSELTGRAPTDVHQQFNYLWRQINESVTRIDAVRGILHIRRHLAVTPLFKGIPNFKQTRIKLLQTPDAQTLLSLIDQIEKEFYS